MTITRSRRPAAAPGAVLVGLLLAGTLLACSGPSPAPSPAAPPATAGSAAPAPSAPAAAPASGAPARPGCAPTGTAVPAGAAVARTADLDHDGTPDELWLADAGGRRLLGVRTASGAVFSTAFTSAAPQQASAVGQELGPDESVVLLDAGRSVPLYAVVDCRLVAAQNPQGQQYTFDLGFTGFGTGVGCEPTPGGPRRWDLYGLQAHEAAGGRWTVTGTRIDLGERGRTARNGPARDLATGEGADSAAVAAAHTVTCGDQKTGPGEPQP